MNMQDIEKLASYYANARDELNGRVQLMQAEMEKVKAEHLPRVRQLVRTIAANRSKLHTAIDQHPELFEKPKTVVVHGMRIGYMKQRGRVEIDDEEAVIDRVRKLLPEEQAELLIRVRESVDKNAVADLTVADLKRLGITVTADQDVVVIKPIDGEIDKLVKALLSDAEQIDQEAAA